MTYYAYILMLLVELVFLIGIATYAIGILYSGLMGAPYVPTSGRAVDDILKKAGLKKDQVFMELGSGDGRLVRTAVKTYGVHGVGIEINQLLVLWSRFLSRRQHLTGIEFRRENIFNTNLAEADVLYLFLMPELLRKMDGRFHEKLRKGTLVISHGFKLEGWQDKMTDKIEREPFSTYFYRV